MPISYPDAFPVVGFKIIRERPTSFLDVGCGFGMMGMLAREYTDIDLRRYQRHEWKTRVDGIEVFPGYITELQRLIYNTIYVGDALDVLPSLGVYDLVVCCDVLEHLDEKDGSHLLDLITLKCKKALISTPVRFIKQGAVFGNEHETHRKLWTQEELKPRGKIQVRGQALILEIEGPR